MHRKYIGIALVSILCALVAASVFALRPVSLEASTRRFEVNDGEGFRDIVSRLSREGFIRSRSAFTVFAVASGSARLLKPGAYQLSPSMSGPEILSVIIRGQEEIEVVIPEGATIYDIDRILSAQGVVPAGALIAAGEEERLEGKLFPDTYRFFAGTPVREVIGAFLKNFERKAAPWLSVDANAAYDELILASLLEREVPVMEDRRVVAGILKKRLAEGMPLQVDATICYVKQMRSQGEEECIPLAKVDFSIDSPYNTYHYPGFPPAPIGNPGREAIEAARSALDSPHWYYLTDPETKTTIFSKTLDEHNRNRVKYHLIP